MDCLHYRDQVLDNCRALFDADVRILTYTRAPLNSSNCIASKLNYHAIIVPKDSMGKLGREGTLLGPSHALSRQGAVVSLLKQTEELLGEMLQEREEGGKKGKEVVGDGWDSGRGAISVDQGLDFDSQHQELDIKCDSQKLHSVETPLNISPDQAPLLAPKPALVALWASLAQNTETEAKSSPNPRDSEIGIALGIRDSSLGAGRSSWGAGSEWRLRPGGRADSVLPEPPLPQAPLAEQDSATALVKTLESGKLQIPTLSPRIFSKPTPVPQPLSSPKYVGQTQATCSTPTIHRESFVTAAEGGMHRGGVSGSSGPLSPFSPCWDSTGEHSVGRSSYQSTGSDTAQYESGNEEGYESEISQTTFATDSGFITPRSTTPTSTECLDSKRGPAQDLSSFNRTLLKYEVELAMKTMLYGLAGQVGSPKGLSWDSC